MAVILVVEDDIFILESLEWVMEDLGHNSLLASDLAGALFHLTAPHHIDALFVDIRLDRLTFGGYDVARYVHFFCMAAIVAFLVIHILLALLVPKSLRAMIIGK